MILPLPIWTLPKVRLDAGRDLIPCTQCLFIFSLFVRWCDNHQETQHIFHLNGDENWLDCGMQQKPLAPPGDSLLSWFVKSITLRADWGVFGQFMHRTKKILPLERQNEMKSIQEVRGLWCGTWQILKHMDSQMQISSDSSTANTTIKTALRVE